MSNLRRSNHGQVSVSVPQPGEGRSSPLGATLSREGANFSVYSKHVTGIELLLFDRADDARPARGIRIDPATNRTYHYWHVYVPGVKAGQIYGYRVSGAFDPSSGMRFDDRKLLLDPYGLGDNTVTAMKSVVADPSAYDWEGDTPLNRSSYRTIIYEMHVRGFTRHESSVSQKTSGARLRV